MDMDKLVLASQSNFMQNFYKALIRNDDMNNIFVSPISVHIILVVLYMASDKELKKILSKNLKFDNENNFNDMLNEYKTILSKFETLNKTDFRILNKVYIKSNYELMESFELKIKDTFRTEISNVDFMNGDDVNLINNWCYEQTSHRISRVFDPINFNENTRLVLLNLIYFNQKWLHTFDKNKTTECEFYLSNGQMIITPMMNIKKNLYYASESDFDILEIPYADNFFKMIILLPHDEISLSDFENKFLMSEIFKSLENLTQVKVDLLLPKFRIEASWDLKSILEKINYEHLFDQKNCTLPNLLKNSDQNLAVSDFVQKAFINVNEEGTEAAAISVATIQKRSIDFDISFVANKPFMFFILESKNNMVMFMGRVNEPLKSNNTYSSNIERDEL